MSSVRGPVSIDASFSTGQGAMFTASLSQLVEQLPGWRSPLAQPERRTVTNPFTGETIPDILTRDPGPRSHPAIPRTLAFPCVVLPSREDWEQNYLALDLALSGEPPLDATAWDDGWLGLMFERGLFVEPLFGGADDVGSPRDLLEVPNRLVQALLDLRSGDFDVLANSWIARSLDPPDSPVDFLARFAELAHLSVARQTRLFTWNITPLHRDRSGSG
jgi:hypothetical protein